MPAINTRTDVDVDALLSGLSSAIAGAISTDDIYLDGAAVSNASGSSSMASTALGAPAPQQQDVAADASSSGSTIRLLTLKQCFQQKFV